MPKIVSVALDKDTEHIYNKLNKARPYGWFSKDIRAILIGKYGFEKNLLIEKIHKNQEKIEELYRKNKEMAKKAAKLK